MLRIILLISFICYGGSAVLPEVLPLNCDNPCTLELNPEPTCVFNGEGYEIFEDSCVLQAVNCTRGFVLEIVEMRHCLERIVVDPEFDVCSRNCPLYLNPVCATNGKIHKMFDNSCLLEIQNCQDNSWTLAPKSICMESESNEELENCEKICTREYEPVCGYDGRNYTVFSNKCEYEVSDCIREDEWNRVPVITCNRKLNLNLRIPDDEQNVDCPTSCHKIYLPVCGFDGVNYKLFSNLCTLNLAHCELDKNWTEENFVKCLYRKSN